MASEERFGYEWEKYAEMDPIYEEQFRNWTNLTPETVAGKDILDAGCGMGRNSYWPLSWGAKSVTGIDNDDRTLASAKKTLAEFPNATVTRCDISNIPWENQFDIVMCIGVLHHLRNPELALKNFSQALRPDGRLVIWVYSYEGNEWIVRLVDPVRKAITSKLPLSVVHLLAYFCSIPLYLFVKLFRGPSPYLKQLSTFRFHHTHSIVFDQLIPSVANYWRHDEVFSLAQSAGVKNISVELTKSGTGWILTGTK
ncbi:MAG: hypothetical protein QG621_143 [Patescibacteria group bacterium]|nr:hypothetical protein [Patescibacteria group bacterium]